MTTTTKKAANTYTNGTQPQAKPQTGIIDPVLLQLGAHDDGNAEATLHRYPDRFLFTDALGWLHYTGTHWSQDGAESAVQVAVTETLHARLASAAATGQAEYFKSIFKECIPNRSRVLGAVGQLKIKVQAKMADFNTDPFLLNCPNGVVDLRTGALMPHTPNVRFTYCIPTKYDPAADQLFWMNWLMDTVKAIQAAWLQKAVGYALTGSTREEILFYLLGPSRSGKGTFIETLLAMLGQPLAEAISFDVLTAPRDADTQGFRLAPLHSARLIAASESNTDEAFNEAKLKMLTGGDTITCAFKHGQAFSYQPKFKIWLTSNHPPVADPNDDAAWGRLRVIEFPNSHLGKEDKLLKTKMQKPAVLEGILAWAVAGAAAWYSLGAAGLPEIQELADLKEKQRSEADDVHMWLMQNIQTAPGKFTPFSALYGDYHTWCKDNAFKPQSSTKFSLALKRHGYTPTRKRANPVSKLQRGYEDLEVIP
jgi:putative DNA primase/helicase